MSINHGKWSEPSVPHKGWSCVDTEDLGEPSHTCEMCEFAECRYVHYMEHPDYPQVLGVGCVCAEHMEEDYVAPREREKRMRSRASRRSRWLSRQWRTSGKGNPSLNSDGYNIVVYQTGAAMEVPHCPTRRGDRMAIQAPLFDREPGKAWSVRHDGKLKEHRT